MINALVLQYFLACAQPPAEGVQHHDVKATEAFLTGHSTAVVVDVRTPGEFAAGHLDGAVNIDFKSADFATSIAALPKDQPLVVHCQSGGRSRASLPAFKEAGFTDVHHMDGGFGAWAGAGLPVAK